MSRDNKYATPNPTSEYQDIDQAFKKISNNKLSNIYFNIANSEVDNKEVIPGIVLSNEGEKDTNSKLEGGYNNHSFAPKNTYRKNEEF